MMNGAAKSSAINGQNQSDTENCGTNSPADFVAASQSCPSDEPASARLTAKQLADLPWVHVYSQWNPHRPATIFGSRAGLIALRDALSAAIEGGTGAARVFATDGEGYPIHIFRTYRSGMPAPQYMDTIALDNGREHDRWTVKWQRARDTLKAKADGRQ